jgi:hypothetical protein
MARLSESILKRIARLEALHSTTRVYAELKPGEPEPAEDPARLCLSIVISRSSSAAAAMVFREAGRSASPINRYGHLFPQNVDSLEEDAAALRIISGG